MTRSLLPDIRHPPLQAELQLDQAGVVQQLLVPAPAADELRAQWQSGVVDAGGQRDRGQSEEGRDRLQRMLTGGVAWRRGLVRRRQDEQVEALEVLVNEVAEEALGRERLGVGPAGHRVAE